MKNLIENIKIFIQMAFIGGLILYIGTTVFMPDLTIKIFRYQPFVVVTESMQPYLNVNDVVVATVFDESKAEVGDVITFEADIDYNGTTEVVTHYIYSIDRSGEETILRTNRYFEEGETVTPDTWLIPASNVIGTYSVHFKQLGLLIGFIKSVYGIVIIAFNIAIIYAIKYINKKAKQAELAQVNEQQVVDQPVVQV